MDGNVARLSKEDGARLWIVRSVDQCEQGWISSSLFREASILYDDGVWRDACVQVVRDEKCVAFIKAFHRSSNLIAVLLTGSESHDCSRNGYHVSYLHDESFIIMKKT